MFLHIISFLSQHIVKQKGDGNKEDHHLEDKIIVFTWYVTNL